MRRNKRRVAVSGPAQEQYVPVPLVAPILGWRVSDNIAAMPPESAYQCDNFFPLQTGVRVRGGSRRHARVHASDAVTSMFGYVSGNIKKFFAATATSIFEVTTVADNNVPPSADVTGQTSGYYSTAQFSNDAGEWLYAVNGDDDPQIYDGSAFQQVTDVSTPIAMSGATNLSFVWKYRNRLFFAKKNSMSIFYLPEVNAVGGTLDEFPMSGVFQKGGYVLFGGTWSVDTGDGMDDKWFAITTEGEVAVYEGNNPGDADAWSLVGRYDISPPLGSRAMWQVGGDVQIGTINGIVTLSQALATDEIKLEIVSASAAIDPEWRREAARRRQLPWEMMKWPTKGMGVVSLPSFSNEVPRCYVVNLKTQAWARYTGWDTRCMVIHDEQLYFGTSDGRILQAEVGGLDDDALYTCALVFAPNHLGSPGRYKTLYLARGVFLSNHSYEARLSASSDYVIELPTAPNAVDIPTISGVFDTAQWDVDVFDQESASASAVSEWQAIGLSGFVLSPQVQITIGSTGTPSIELVALDTLSIPGDIPV